MVGVEKFHVPCDAFDFEEDVLGKARDLDGGTGRLVTTEKFGVDAVDGGKVVHILQKNLSQDVCTRW